MKTLTKVMLTLALFAQFNAYSFTKITNGYIITPAITKEFIQPYLPKNPVILEAGAYDGSDTVEMIKLWNPSMIYSFEPVPHLFDAVMRKTSNQPRSKCFKAALSDKNGTATFYVSSTGGDGSSSLLKPKGHLETYPHVQFKHTITVETVTLDDWAERNNVDHVDFMWLDMQGSEYQMLKASTKILPTIKVIYTEVNHCELYEGCGLYPQYKSWLESQGFMAVAEDFDTWSGNALFVRCNPAPSESL